MSFIHGEFMSENSNSNNRRKTLVTLIAAFLLIGGGIFVFFVFQGLGDLTNDNKSGFSYGFATRNVFIPLSNYFNLGDNDVALARRTGEKLKSPEDVLSEDPSGDVSDWMANGDAGNESEGTASASSQSSEKTSIPAINGALSGMDGGGGGESQSSLGISELPDRTDRDNVKITGAQSGRGGLQGRGVPQGRSGTFNSLSTARASLSKGLKSGSAMTAKASWDQGFGAGGAGAAKKGGELAYGKAGLVGLDHIKSGDISDLKLTNDPKSLKVAAPGAPVRDEESEAKDKKNKKAKYAEKAMGALVKKFNSLNEDKGGNGAEAEAPNANKPPEEVVAAATTESPEGSYCPKGCDGGTNGTYTDTKLSYQKADDGKWQVTYEGTQSGPNCNPSCKYRDETVANPGGKPPVQLVKSFIQDPKTGKWECAVPGSVTPCPK